MIISSIKSYVSFLPFAKPDVDQREIDAVSTVIAFGWLTTGPKVRQFEAEFATRVGAKHAIAANSATSFMHLALEAIGLQAGDEVITTTTRSIRQASGYAVTTYFTVNPLTLTG